MRFPENPKDGDSFIAASSITYTYRDAVKAWIVTNTVETSDAIQPTEAYREQVSYAKGQTAVRGGLLVAANAKIPAGTPFAWGLRGKTWRPVLGEPYAFSGIYDSKRTYADHAVVAITASDLALRVFRDGQSWSFAQHAADIDTFGGANIYDRYDGKKGLVPAPTAEDMRKPLLGYGIFDTPVRIDVGDPQPTNDASHAFYVGMFWLNTEKNRLYICKDATKGKAIWLKLFG